MNKSKILKSPIIILVMISLCCVAGIFVDGVTQGTTFFEGESLFGPIGVVVGFIAGFVILWQASERGVFSILNQLINPFYKKHREYAAMLTVGCSESEAFSYCVSMVRATDVRFKTHADLGTIAATTPSRTFLFPSVYVSFGLMIMIKVEPVDPNVTLIAIDAISDRSIMGLWMPSWAERWNYEAKTVAEDMFDTLRRILDRQGIAYGDYEVLE